MSNESETCEKWAFPPLHEYALAKPCSTCGAEPGRECTAPRKSARLERIDEVRRDAGAPAIQHDPARRMHAGRVEAGHRHLVRDRGRAPLPEDRVPGRSYSTLHPVPLPPPRPEPPTPGTGLPTRATAVFGRSSAGIAWPYGLATPTRRTYRNRPEAYEEALRRAGVAQETITAWAERYGLRSSPTGCCPRWLGRPTSRRCRDEGCTRYDAPARDAGWLDHTVAWLCNGRPAALTSAPYGAGPEDQARLAWWTHKAPGLRTAEGKGWYGFGTAQIVMWRADILGEIKPAEPQQNLARL